MGEASGARGWFRRNRDLILLAIVLYLIPMASINMISSFYNSLFSAYPEQFDPTYEPSHDMTVWVTPKNESFTLYTDFYMSQADAESHSNRLIGTGASFDLDDDGRREREIYVIPEFLQVVWVELRCSETEDHRIVRGIQIGVRTSIVYLHRMFEILMEPWSGE